MNYTAGYDMSVLQAVLRSSPPSSHDYLLELLIGVIEQPHRAEPADVRDARRYREIVELLREHLAEGCEINNVQRADLEQADWDLNRSARAA